jgi:hypothetical protein
VTIVVNGKRCPKCRKSVRVRKDGSLAKHMRGPVTLKESAVAIEWALIGQRWSVVCEAAP